MNTTLYQCDFCGKSIIRKVAPSITSKTHFCNNTCKSEYQRTFKPVSREWLYDHYIRQKLDTTQIAHIVHRDPKSVWNWLKDFNIPTRGRGTDTRQHFKKGKISGFAGKKHTEDAKKRFREIAKADGRVPFNPAVGSYMKGKKGKDTPNWKGGVTPDRQACYSSIEWVNAVKSVWKRDNATCQRCGKHHNQAVVRGTFTIHHIVSFAVKHLRTDVSNLILLCQTCHRWIHSKRNEQKEFIKGM